MKFHTKTSRILFFFMALWLSISSAGAEDRKIYTLETSIAEAFENNRTLKASGERIAQAENVKNQARADFLPKLGFSYGYTRLGETPIARGSFEGIPGGQEIVMGTRDNYRLTSTVNQPLFTGFALVSNYQLAELGVDQSQLDYEQQTLGLALKVKEAYFGILIADRAVDVAEKDVTSRESNVDVVRNFYEVGMSPVNDLLKAEVALANTRQNLIKAGNDARLARSRFNTVLARPVNAPVHVEDILTSEHERASFDVLLTKALNNRPAIKLLDVRIDQVDQQIRLARSKFFPEINLSYNYINEGDEPSVSGSEYTDSGHWEVMASASWTFFEWGKTRYSVREKESLRKELLQTRLALEDSIALELKQALLEMKTAKENIPTTKKAVEQGEENLRVNQERYKAQVSTITDVLDAQTLLTQARVNYYRALYSFNLAKAGLLRALGTY